MLLEAEWVLRGPYGYPPAQIGETLRAFAGLPRVTLEDPALSATALNWMGKGMDFADALHLAAAEGCTAFVSFDRRFEGRQAAESNCGSPTLGSTPATGQPAEPTPL